ncbi:MAG: transcription antitermination protein NusB [Calditerrivibrio sp.]|nr:transcription antitermination protein NusB [Calditerrivibrio sp.]
MSSKKQKKMRKYALDLYYIHNQTGDLMEYVAENLIKFQNYNKDILTKSIGLLKEAMSNVDFTDDLIEKYLKKDWSIDRLPVLDLLILRLAIFELFRSDDVIEVIDDYVSLASKYSDHTSPFYINGILEKIKNDFGLNKK